MKEIRLYIINSEMSDPTDYNAVSDEHFIKVAEEQIIYYVTPDEIKLPEQKIREIVENAISE